MFIDPLVIPQAAQVVCPKININIDVRANLEKIFPANLIDKKMLNSLGVILDDIIAGIYTVSPNRKKNIPD